MCIRDRHHHGERGSPHTDRVKEILESEFECYGKEQEFPEDILKYMDLTKEKAETCLLYTSGASQGCTCRPPALSPSGLMKQLCPTVKGVVYVPYQSVGTTSGILPAVFIDRMEIEQELSLIHI